MPRKVPTSCSDRQIALRLAADLASEIIRKWLNQFDHVVGALQDVWDEQQMHTEF
jgi:hypothetical protein